MRTRPFIHYNSPPEVLAERYRYRDCDHTDCPASRCLNPEPVWKIMYRAICREKDWG